MVLSDLLRIGRKVSDGERYVVEAAVVRVRGRRRAIEVEVCDDYKERAYGVIVAGHSGVRGKVYVWSKYILRGVRLVHAESSGSSRRREAPPILEIESVEWIGEEVKLRECAWKSDVGCREIVNIEKSRLCMDHTIEVIKAVSVGRPEIMPAGVITPVNTFRKNSRGLCVGDAVYRVGLGCIMTISSSGKVRCTWADDQRVKNRDTCKEIISSGSSFSTRHLACALGIDKKENLAACVFPASSVKKIGFNPETGAPHVPHAADPHAPPRRHIFITKLPLSGLAPRDIIEFTDDEN